MTARPRFLKRPRVGRVAVWAFFAAIGWAALSWLQKLS